MDLITTVPMVKHGGGSSIILHITLSPLIACLINSLLTRSLNFRRLPPLGSCKRVHSLSYSQLNLTQYSFVSVTETELDFSKPGILELEINKSLVAQHGRCACLCSFKYSPPLSFSLHLFSATPVALWKL